ncbi:hypothetical protein SAMN05428970_2004 [Agromyces sp. CF514]|uniref:hypothetical protein n=1 Tax=Agromyces sp. CF514 TaxID=1881031 RepID=UPI0008E5D405|nr:hypothetical protein [Agromyces sp. CF514]SFR76017.1 hypothetical protein SAMN05428970_2004 [Agromyces sp. CF514]
MMDQVAAVERIIGRTFYREPATVDEPHRVLYDGEGDWLLGTDCHVGEDVA